MFEKNPDNCIDVTAGGAAALADDDFASAGESAPSAPEISTPPKSDKRGYVNLTRESLPNTFNTASSDRMIPRKKIGYRFIKRAFDLGFSIFAMLLGLVPGLILCAIVAIDTRSTPIYRQSRVGRYGKSFDLFKFRSMVGDADNVEKYFTDEQRRQWDRERKVEDDPRVTKVGRLLRATSMDELPQFANVILGHMSIIGPRPITEDELEWFGSDRDLLLSVPAGITGWWQVTSRNDATYENGERQELELFYVRNACVALDWKVFLGTFATIFRKTGR